MAKPSFLALGLFAVIFLTASVLSIADQSNVVTIEPQVSVVSAEDCEVPHDTAPGRKYIIN